jgi:hypothetical protein
MIDKFYIQKRFNNKIEEKFKDRFEIKKFFLNHERKDILFDNLIKEIKKADLNFPLRSKYIDEIIDSFTLQFCRIALLNKEQQIISEVELNRIKKEKERQLDLMDKVANADIADCESL